jgi:hypothetical protein
MKPGPEDVEVGRVLGYLGSDDVFYCSPGCAAERGQTQAAPVDQDEYQALLDRGWLAPGVVCPVCGADYPLDLPVGDER